MRPALTLLAYGGAGLLILYSSIVYRFLNPDLSETRLFYGTWHLIAVAVVLLIVGAQLAKNRRHGVRRKVDR